MRRVPWILVAGLIAACGAPSSASEPDTTPLPTPPPTVPGVGVLPNTLPADRTATAAPLVVITRPVTEDGVLIELVGDTVSGNRLLLIGDSIFAGTERRYGGEMCDGLVPLGWAVDIEAEAGRFVEFGVKVMKRLVPEQPVADDELDWDAAVVHLGSNYNGNQAYYEEKLREILDGLAPRPTLLLTVTEYRSNYSEVNETIRTLGDEYDNITVIDWGAAARTPGVLMPDGLHPNNDGEEVLVALIAAALGRAPVGEAECIRPEFTDDSAIKAGNGTPNTDTSSSGGSSSGSTSGGSNTTTTVRPRPTTTTSPGGTTGGSTTTTSPGGTTGGSTTTSPGGTTGGSTTTSPGGTTGGGSSTGGASTTNPPTTTTNPPTTTTTLTKPPPPPTIPLPTIPPETTS